ncbi:RCC1 domain-containing protein, partial [Candidatus Venteria ishoeyi]|uniref:RCC1 domain-containing protein n=1 Tax=Candidatus Venteria ishoeyi TaxID=1899563 RepID=UPI0015B14019
TVILSLGNITGGSLGANDTALLTITDNDSLEVGAVISVLGTGLWHACAIDDTGTLKCWGKNHKGQLGNGTTTDSNWPLDVVGLAGSVTSVSAGESHTCVLVSGGVQCWGGGNYYGQLGNGSTTDSTTPVNVTGLSSGVVGLSAGHNHTCAILSNGSVKCWGNNNGWMLGDENSINESKQTSPVSVTGLADTVSIIAAGRGHTCALLTNGTMQCWGSNGAGQLGNGSHDAELTPTTVPGLSSITRLSAAQDYTCALLSSGGVKCWGANDVEQVGMGTGSITNQTTPVSVANLSSVSELYSSYYHTCALLNTATAKCWGANWSGQLGNDSTQNSDSPVNVSNLNNITELTAGGGHSCALLSDGTVKCWGDNQFGQLGDGSNAEHHVPVQINFGPPPSGNIPDMLSPENGSQLSWGHADFVWQADDFSVDAWRLYVGTSQGSGNLFDSRELSAATTSLTVNNLPIDSSTLFVRLFNKQGNSWEHKDFTYISAGRTALQGKLATGAFHTCTIQDELVKCWGQNDQGQLGDGTGQDNTVPTLVAALSGEVSHVVAGYGHSCALLASGPVKCWGDNAYGQLGNGSTQDSGIAVNVSGLSNNISALTAGHYHSCALDHYGNVKCWGRNDSGQLG